MSIYNPNLSLLDAFNAFKNTICNKRFNIEFNTSTGNKKISFKFGEKDFPHLIGIQHYFDKYKGNEIIYKEKPGYMIDLIVTNKITFEDMLRNKPRIYKQYINEKRCFFLYFLDILSNIDYFIYDVQDKSKFEKLGVIYAIMDKNLYPKNLIYGLGHNNDRYFTKTLLIAKSTNLYGISHNDCLNIINISVENLINGCFQSKIRQEQKMPINIIENNLINKRIKLEIKKYSTTRNNVWGYIDNKKATISSNYLNKSIHIRDYVGKTLDVIVEKYIYDRNQYICKLVGNTDI